MVGTADRFQRTRDVNVAARWFPATTINRFNIDILTEVVRQPADLILPAADFSSVVIQAPRYIVGATFPASDSRANTLEGEQERLTVPLKTTRLESHEVRFQVLSPLLHWYVGQRIATMSAFSGIEWLWGLIFGLLQKRISEVVLEPLFGRWIPGKKSPESDPDNP
jgi:hypothetical protein